MKPLLTLIFVSLASVTALGVYTVISYNRSSRDLVELDNRTRVIQGQIQEQSDRLKQLTALLQQKSDATSAETGNSPREIMKTITTRLDQVEQQVKAVTASNPQPIQKESSAAPSEDQKQITEAAVKKVLKEKEQERAEQFKQDMQAQGAEFVAKKITTMTEAQKQVIAPIVGDHAYKLAEMWWLGTAVDEQGKPLSSEERVKRSEQLRIELNEKVKAQLTPSQQAELQSWITERKDKKAKNERVEGDGVFSWLFY